MKKSRKGKLVWEGTICSIPQLFKPGLMEKVPFQPRLENAEGIGLAHL